MMELPVVAALVAAVLGPLIAYLIAARQFSGKIETSDAKELWAESRSIRDWSQQRITQLNDMVERLEQRVDALEASNDELVEENRTLRRVNQECLETNAVLREKVDSFAAQLEHARKRIAELEEKNDRHAGP